jgi:hypothetical protein
MRAECGCEPWSIVIESRRTMLLDSMEPFLWKKPKKAPRPLGFAFKVVVS